MSEPTAGAPQHDGDRRDALAARLAAGVAAGDREAFAAFYEAWFDRMHAMARRATRRDESFCLDVVQEAMMRAIRRLPPLDSEASLAAWLRRTVERCAADRLRAEARRLRRERRAARGEASAVDAKDPAHDAAAALDALPAAQTELLVARFGRGWSLARIGAALGLSTGAVDGRIGRLLADMRRRLDDDDKS